MGKIKDKMIDRMNAEMGMTAEAIENEIWKINRDRDPHHEKTSRIVKLLSDWKSEVCKKQREELLFDNPYPETVFHEPIKNEWKHIAKILKDAGYTSDAIFGAWGRRVWNNYREDILNAPEPD